MAILDGISGDRHGLFAYQEGTEKSKKDKSKRKKNRGFHGLRGEKTSNKLNKTQISLMDTGSYSPVRH